MEFGAGSANSGDTLHGAAKWCIALIGLGGSAWAIDGVFLSSWVAFGEVQAKSARTKLFRWILASEQDLLYLRKGRLRWFLIRIQMYVGPLLLVQFAESSGKFESSNWQSPSRWGS